MSLKKSYFILLMSICSVCEAQVNLTNGLVGYWNFDGNVQDSSGNGNHGTLNGATLTTDRCGRPNMAYAFDGIDDFVQAGNLISSYQNASISVWVKTTDSPTGVARGIVSKPRAPALGGFSIEFTQVGHPTGAFKFLSGINTGNNVQLGAVTTSTMNNGRWRHLVGTIGTVGGLSRSKVYLDGQFVAEGPFTPNASTSTQLIQIGREFAVAGQAGRYFKGDIDDTRIYDRVLSAAEVLALYNLEKCPSISNTSTPNGSCCTLRTVFKKGKVVVQTSGVINRRGQIVSPANALKTVNGAPNRFLLRSYRAGSGGRARHWSSIQQRIPRMAPVRSFRRVR